jgi:hypothetical protein
MTVVTARDGNTVRVLIYGARGATLPAGEHSFMQSPVLNGCQIVSVDVATAGGAYVQASIAASAALPSGYALDQNYPNPFNPETRIEFSLPRAGQVDLSIYDVLGRKVRTLVFGPMEAGRHSTTWNGRDDNGSTTASGVYFYRLQADAEVFTRKMVFLK